MIYIASSSRAKWFVVRMLECAVLLIQHSRVTDDKSIDRKERPKPFNSVDSVIHNSIPGRYKDLHF